MGWKMVSQFSFSACFWFFAFFLSCWYHVESIGVPFDEHVTGKGFEYNCTGDCTDIQTKTIPGLVLMGGGTDVDEAFKWMIDRSGGGNFVIIRAFGTDAYNSYINKLGRVHSVATILITSSDGANSDFVYEKISKCEALFIAGGDQWKYITLWNNTQVSKAIKQLVRNGVPIGGTSAGAMILGEDIYTAENGGVISSEALENPYISSVSLGKNFIDFSDLLRNTLVDTHFYQRDRMGRIITFLARLETDFGKKSYRGIAVDEATAVLLDVRSGIGRVVNYDGRQEIAHSVHFLEVSSLPEVCKRGRPLTFSDVSTYRLEYGDSFNFLDWKPVSRGISSYTLSANRGYLDSTQRGGYIY